MNNEILFEQTYMAARVVKTPESYEIEFSILGGPSISVSETDELKAKAIYKGLETAYLAGLKQLQEDMLAGLEKLTSESIQTLPDSTEDTADRSE